MKNVTDAGELATRAKAVEAQQKELLASMDEILQRMAKIESKQELANRLDLILKWSRELLNTIEKKKAKEAGSVFDEPTSQPAEK